MCIRDRYQRRVRWPEYFTVAEDTCGRMMGYIMGKVEGKGENWHGHVTAVTVAPEFRRLGIGRKMMYLLEEISEKMHDAYFVDLFVRYSNNVAVGMYKKLDYIIYHQVEKYYSGKPAEDAYDMRKALPRDVNKKSVVPPERQLIKPNELLFD
eukprot:TRINITY_DN4597_c0_g1_i2.p1 TRINITY_DN4597_c0_g1~~TRINITY_DN4597_c0_g1_i2.p1  ORF type:complete len:152 (+),score=26.60 TRINITY_DN4597_c0_g1_i2:46-501(+)